MASEQCVLDYACWALWDPTPTDTSDRRARQLAVALGYPLSWRVVRTLEPVVVGKIDTTKSITTSNTSTTATTSETTTKTIAAAENETPINDDTTATSANSISKERVATHTSDTEDHHPPAQYCIVDRIYAGKPGTGCDMWYHHEAACAAAAANPAWYGVSSADDDNDNEDGTTNKTPTPYDSNGGHMLPRQPMFAKGDKVQVLYDNQWWDASVLRRKEHKDGFKYQVHYVSDGSKQSGVDEINIRRRPEAPDPKLVAASLGLDGWDAYATGHHRWKIVAPNGDVYHGKKQALLAYQKALEQTNKDVGDPPWRRDANDYLGRTVIYVLEHKASARRTVKIDQTGTVTGWISDTDVDRAGEPGFVSERTGKPARLFHVVFEEVPHHPYASLLLDSIDLEEYELEQCLVPAPDDPATEASTEPPQKVARKG